MIANEKILSVSELTGTIKNLLETSPDLSDCWVRGEISNFTHHSSGHMYFTLKDAGSRVKSVMFASRNRSLNFLPKDGMKVIVHGNISVFERDGQYQLYVDEMQPDGLGSLYLAFQQLKERLEKEGLFAERHKKPLPVYPKVIGVVTSPTGAAVRDIMTTIRRRYPIAHVLLYPVLVQGAEAPGSIARAIESFNQMEEYRADVLIVGRGGGSLEELWAFNEEIVARAIFASTIPIISAVGHETDFTIADFVADIRAATPTGAAELAVPHFAELLRHLDGLQQRLTGALSTRLREMQSRLERISQSSVFAKPTQRIHQLQQQVDRMENELELLLTKWVSNRQKQVHELNRRLTAKSPVERLMRMEQRLGYSLQKLQSVMNVRLDLAANRFHRTIDKLDAYSPLQVMKRGYSLTYRDGKGVSLVRSIRQLQLGDRVHVRVSDGWLDCQVWGMEEDEGDAEQKASGKG